MKTANWVGVIALGVMAVLLAFSALSANEKRPLQMAAAPATNQATVPPTSQAAYPLPPAPSPYPYPPPAPTPERTRAPRPTFPPPPTWTPAPTRTPLIHHGPNDPADEAAIKAVIERSYRVHYTVHQTGDLEPLTEVYINHPSHRLAGDYLRQYRDLAPTVAGRLPDPGVSPGLLDYWRVFYTYRRMDREQVSLLVGTATALANPTARAARATLHAQYEQGTPVALPAAPTAAPAFFSGAYTPPTLRYFDIYVQRDRAVVHLDDGPFDKRLVLVRTADGWRIAEEVILDVHV